MQPVIELVQDDGQPTSPDRKKDEDRKYEKKGIMRAGPVRHRCKGVNADPRRYLDRLARWEASVRKAGATDWVVVNDLENNMESILITR